MKSLSDEASGCFLVTTESGSRYWLDLNRRVLRRSANEAATVPRRMRRDDEDLELVEVVTCKLGQPMLLLLNLNVPGVIVTRRESTLVVRIDEVPHDLVEP